MNKLIAKLGGGERKAVVYERSSLASLKSSLGKVCGLPEDGFAISYHFEGEEYIVTEEEELPILEESTSAIKILPLQGCSIFESVRLSKEVVQREAEKAPQSQVDEVAIRKYASSRVEQQFQALGGFLERPVEIVVPRDDLVALLDRFQSRTEEAISAFSQLINQ